MDDLAPCNGSNLSGISTTVTLDNKGEPIMNPQPASEKR